MAPCILLGCSPLTATTTATGRRAAGCRRCIMGCHAKEQDSKQESQDKAVKIGSNILIFL